MYRSAMTALLFVALATGVSCGAAAGPAGAVPAAATEPNALDKALKNLEDKATALKSYQVDMDYVFKQPLLESQQRRTGVLYYAKFEKESFLRIDFNTLQQDEEKQQTYQQQYVFDGVWLLEVDHQLKTATRRQLAEPNRPLDAFALASKHLPVLGFSKVEDLRQQFEISLVAEPQADAAAPQHLHLKVKPDSVYKDDYVTIDFWIDRQIGLPMRVEAITPEEDVYQIKLTDPKVNAPLERKLFEVEIPRSFSVEAVPLAKRTDGKPSR
jgi:outer membrane lipoprotein-sorting protein